MTLQEIVAGIASAVAIHTATNYVLEFLGWLEEPEIIQTTPSTGGGTGGTTIDFTATNSLLRDVIHTNKALLQFHEVRANTYQPLENNI